MSPRGGNLPSALQLHVAALKTFRQMIKQKNKNSSYQGSDLNIHFERLRIFISLGINDFLNTFLVARVPPQAQGSNWQERMGARRLIFFSYLLFSNNQYALICRNIHSDIQMCVNGWFEQRCPLAYLGCTYSQKRLQPSTHEANITYK